MRAVVIRHQWSQFTCSQHSARAMGVPEHQTKQYRMPRSAVDEGHLSWHDQFLKEVDRQVTSGQRSRIRRAEQTLFLNGNECSGIMAPVP